MTNNTIVQAAAAAATVYLEEELKFPPRDAALAQAVIETAVEAALVKERERLLKPEEN